MLTLKDICKTYRIGDEVVRALDHASLHVNAGEFVSIIGPSGSGKSTLMNLLDGTPIEDYTENELAMVRSRKIGFVFQSFNLIPQLTAYENVELPLIYQRVKKSERKARVMDALQRVQLTSRMHHLPSELSGGQQQRVAIARAIAAHPALILADEPTGNLDSHTGQDIMEIFHDLHHAGNTIVLITHDPSVAKQADRAIHILDGKVSEVAL